MAAAATHAAQGDDYSAEKVAREILSRADVPGEFRVQAWLWVAKAQSLYGNAEAWAKVRAACEEVLKVPGLASPFQIQALRLSVPACLALRDYPAAEMAQRALMAHPGISAWERRTYRLALARTLLLQRAFAETRELLSASVPPAANGDAPLFWLRALEEWGADRQLLWSLTFYEETPSARARLELMDVLSIAGHRVTDASTREARLRLHQQRWLRSKERTSTVLFVGSSHTIRGNVPLLVEQLAASAPLGRLRIVAGEQTRMGTGMRGHWNDGDAPDTARGKMAAGLWDQVVVETFYRNSREDLLLYGSRYAEVANRCGARLVLYETPVARALEYPGGFQTFQESNLWLARELGVRLGPSVGAWMRILGPQPSEERLGILYADWIHATARGAYLSACCLYAALTGESPIGLFVPEGLLSPEEALRYQQAAWDSYQEAEVQLRARRRERDR
jgi:hypothetical protein